MQRVTITLDDELIQALDAQMLAGGHANRSEAIRDLVRIGLEERGSAGGGARECVGALVYVYDHETRHLAERLNNEQHVHHDLSVATLHVHLDARNCLEVAVLRGASGEVRHFADHVMGERGVQYGRLVSIPTGTAARGGSARPHHHAHSPSSAKPHRPKKPARRTKA